MSALPLMPIPQPNDDDDDEVQWALSTARALLAAGNIDEALQWLRRAGESATDVDQDMRAVELFKAAATIRSTMPPPPASPAPGDGPSSEPISHIRALRPREPAKPPPVPARRKPSLRAIPPPPPVPSSRPIEARARAIAPPRPKHAGSQPGRIVPSMKDTQVGLGQVRLREVGDDQVEEANGPESAVPSSRDATGALENRGSLWAIRFAVIESKRSGRLVLSVLRSDEEPPEGVPSAVIVPRSAWDAERILGILSKGQLP